MGGAGVDGTAFLSAKRQSPAHSGGEVGIWVKCSKHGQRLELIHLFAKYFFIFSAFGTGLLLWNFSINSTPGCLTYQLGFLPPA